MTEEPRLPPRETPEKIARVQAGTDRYFVVATGDGVETEILKFEQSLQSAVIVMSAAGRITDTKSIHITHHPPTGGLATRIMHVSDASGTDVRVPLDPAAHVVELGRLIVTLSDLDWQSTKPFMRTAYREKYVHDVAAHGPYVDAAFYLGEPAAISEAMEHRVSAGWRGMLIPKPSGFGTPPGGHPITAAKIVFDTEATETLACLLLSCHPPKGEQDEKPWTGQRLHWVAYGVGGQVAEGTTDA